MATKKKDKSEVETVTENTESTKLLTENELFDFLTFTNSFFESASKSSKYIGSYTPYLTNQRLGEIGLSPVKLNKKELEKALRNPVVSGDLLSAYSEFLNLTDMVAKRTILYYGNLASFDYTIHCMNINNYNEFDSDEYKKDEKIVKDFLEKFNPKDSFSSVYRRIMTNDTFFGIFRNDGKYNYGFEELPNEYCKITGKNLDWGYIFDFDMSWFNKMGLSIKQYPPIMQEMYDNVTKGGETPYNPANGLKNRKGTFSLWTQTSPLPSKGNFVCFKFNSDISAKVPFLTALFNEAINKPLLRELQNNQYIIASQKILIGLIPLLTGQKSGQINDSFALTADQLGNFLGFLKRGLHESIKISGVPFSDVKQMEFSLPKDNMFNETNKIESSSSGATSSLIYTTDNASATAVKLSSEVDEFISLSVYPQFEKWLSSEINWYTNKYKFRIKFEGTNFSASRERRLNYALRLADKGIVMFDKIASAMGMNEFELEQSLAKSKNGKYRDLLFLLPNANTKDYGEVITGRPQTEIPSDSTDRNQDRDISGGNNGFNE